jgi:uncharacterized coiled-coil protein SlyX
MDADGAGIATTSNMETKLSEILTAITKLDERMSSMETRLSSQASALSGLSDTIGKLGNKLEAMEGKTRDIEQTATEEKAMLEAELASLRDSLANNFKDKSPVIDVDAAEAVMPSHPGSRITPPGQPIARAADGGDAWGAYLANRPTAGRPKITAPAGVPQPSAPSHLHNTTGMFKSNNGNNKLTATQSDWVWVKGYPRDLTTKQLRAEASRILALHEVDEEDVDIIVRGFGRSFAIKFSSAESARDFREEARDNAHEWVDPRDKEVHQLRFMGDKPLFVRLRDRVFASLWHKALPKVVAKHPGGKLGQSRGKLWAIIDDCPVSLFSSRLDPDDPARFQLEADLVNCQDFGISRDDANVWIAAALRTAA